MKKILLATAGATFVALSFAGEATAASLYSVTDLGKLFQLSINESGTVLGDCYGGNCLWENGNITTLNHTAHTPVSLWGDINNQSQAVFYSLLFDNGKLTSFAPQGEYVSIGGINDQGTLVGQIAPSINQPTRAVKWENGQMTYLSTLGGAVSSASHLNNAGQIVGGASLSDGSQHPVLWENDQIIDLGNPFGGKGGSAVDINENRQIIGNYMNSSGNEAAFFWENGQMKDLGDLGGGFTWARAINDAAQIVGVSAHENGSSAVLWDQGNMLDLNNLISENSGWELLFAQDINNKGQIVGYGYFNGEERGFLLNPIEDKPEPKSVPESSPTLGLLGLGILGINSLRKRLQHKEN